MKPKFDILYLKESKDILDQIKDADVFVFQHIIYSVLKARIDNENTNVFKKLPNSDIWEITIPYQIYDFKLL